VGTITTTGGTRDLDGWLHTPTPISLAELRGKAVLVSFWTCSRINSLRPLPNLDRWRAEYETAGLQVVGIHAPVFGVRQRNIRRAAAEPEATDERVLRNAGLALAGLGQGGGDHPLAAGCRRAGEIPCSAAGIGRQSIPRPCRSTVPDMNAIPAAASPLASIIAPRTRPLHPWT
jgi:hypothetical protein